MFRIRFLTPALLDGQGSPLAGAELLLGTDRVRFLADLRYWGIGEYERQWREGISRLVHGGVASALVTAYGGPDPDASHRMWGLWRDADHVYAQELTVLASELDAPFDPSAPWPHVGEHVPAAEQGLSILELRCDLLPLLAAWFFPTLPWPWAGGWGNAAA
ncbi:MAG: hypothetical protein ACREMH_04070 [Gemmatimonadales bacterium]